MSADKLFPRFNRESFKMHILPQQYYWAAAGLLPWLIFPVYPCLAFAWLVYCCYVIYDQFFNVQWLDSKDKGVYVTGLEGILCILRRRF